MKPPFRLAPEDEESSGAFFFVSLPPARRCARKFKKMAKSNKAQEAAANDAVEQVSPQETPDALVWDNGDPLSVPAEEETQSTDLPPGDGPAIDEEDESTTQEAEEGPGLEIPEGQFKVGDKVFCLLSQSRYLRGKVAHGPGETDCYGIQGRAFKSVNKNAVIAVHRSRLAPVAPEGGRKIGAFHTAPSGMKFLLKELVVPAEY